MSTHLFSDVESVAKMLNKIDADTPSDLKAAAVLFGYSSALTHLAFDEEISPELAEKLTIMSARYASIASAFWETGEIDLNTVED